MFPARHLHASQEGRHRSIHQTVCLWLRRNLSSGFSLFTKCFQDQRNALCCPLSELCDPSLMESLLIQKQKSSPCVTENESMSHKDTPEQGTCSSWLHPHHRFILWWSIHQITPLLLLWNDSAPLNTAGMCSIKPTLRLLQSSECDRSENRVCPHSSSGFHLLPTAGSKVKNELSRLNLKLNQTKSKIFFTFYTYSASSIISQQMIDTFKVSRTNKALFQPAVRFSSVRYPWNTKVVLSSVVWFRIVLLRKQAFWAKPWCFPNPNQVVLVPKP